MRAAWGDASCTKGAMRANLEKRLRPGMEKSAIVRLLGEPEQKSDSAFRYFLGYYSGHMTDYDDMVIEFDGQDRLKIQALFIPVRND